MESNGTVVDIASGSTILIVSSVLMIDIGTCSTPRHSTIFQGDAGVIGSSLKSEINV